MIVSSLFYVISAFVYIQESKNNKRKLAMFIVLLGAFILSFSFQPLISDDLTREYSCLDGIRQYGWKYFSLGSSKYYSNSLGVVSSSKFEGLYVTQILYYIFAHFSIYNFLPAVVVTVQFALEFRLLEKIRQRFELTHKELVFLFLLFFLTRELRWMMSGIRNQLAFTIAVYILYGDLVEHKSKLFSAIGLVLCGMIHQSAYVFLAIRILLLIPNKKITSIIALASLLWSGLLESILRFALRYSGLPVINSILWKLTIYTQNDSGANYNIILQPYYVKMVISDIGLIIFAIVTCYLYYTLYKGMKKPEYSVNKKITMHKGVITIHREPLEYENRYIEPEYALFMLLITCITIGSFMYYWFYLRFAMVLEIGLFILSSAVIYELRSTEQYRRRNQYMLLGMAAILLKFLIMVLVANGSFNFDILGFYPQ